MREYLVESQFELRKVVWPTRDETLRTTLAAAGHEARVVESDSGKGVRYRVQVGTFPSREAAREAAARLAAERSLSAFVTTR